MRYIKEISFYHNINMEEVNIELDSKEISLDVPSINTGSSNEIHIDIDNSSSSSKPLDSNIGLDLLINKSKSGVTESAPSSDNSLNIEKNLIQL